MATAITVLNIITDRLSETKRLLVADENTDWDSAEARAILLAKTEVYGYEIAEADIGDARIVEYVGLKACVRLIDFAIDFHMMHEDLAETKDDATFTHHNTVEVLERKKSRIEAEIRTKGKGVIDLIDDSNLGEDSIDVSTLHTDTIAHSAALTPSPWAMNPK